MNLNSIASFMGLACPEETAWELWQAHNRPHPTSDLSALGLSFETVEWMNATMSRLLPPPMLARWGLQVTEA